MKAKDLRDQTVEELEASLLDLKKEIFRLRNELRQNKKIDQPHLLRNNRKDIARILAVLSEKKAAI